MVTSGLGSGLGPGLGSGPAENASTPPPSMRAPHTALLFFALYAIIGLCIVDGGAIAAPWLVCSLLLAATLAQLSSIDLATFRLPDYLTLPLVTAGMLLPWITGVPGVLERGLAAAGAFALLAGVAEAYRRLRGRPGLGLGDAKLFAAAGAWLGAEPLPQVLLWATGATLTAAAVSALRGGAITRETRIAFGPFLAFGFWMAWITRAPL